MIKKAEKEKSQDFIREFYKMFNSKLAFKPLHEALNQSFNLIMVEFEDFVKQKVRSGDITIEFDLKFLTQQLIMSMTNIELDIVMKHSEMLRNASDETKKAFI